MSALFTMRSRCPRGERGQREHRLLLVAETYVGLRVGSKSDARRKGEGLGEQVHIGCDNHRASRSVGKERVRARVPFLPSFNIPSSLEKDGSHRGIAALVRPGEGLSGRRGPGGVGRWRGEEESFGEAGKKGEEGQEGDGGRSHVE